MLTAVLAQPDLCILPTLAVPMPTVRGQVLLVVRVVDFSFQEFAIFRLLLVAVEVATAVLFLVALAVVKQEIIVLVEQQVAVTRVMTLQDLYQAMQEQLQQQAVVEVVTIHLLVRLLEEVKAD
jgi:hypothetical protein